MGEALVVTQAVVSRDGRSICPEEGIVRRFPSGHPSLKTSQSLSTGATTSQLLARAGRVCFGGSRSHNPSRRSSQTHDGAASSLLPFKFNLSPDSSSDRPTLCKSGNMFGQRTHRSMSSRPAPAKKRQGCLQINKKNWDSAGAGEGGGRSRA